MKSIKILGILCLLTFCNLSAHAGIFSKIGNWFNTDWNDYGYRPHSSYSEHSYNNDFYHRGNFTGMTPPVTTIPSNSAYYSQDNNFYCPNNANRFNHFPNGSLPEMNIPTRVINDFSSNVGTGSGVQVLD